MRRLLVSSIRLQSALAVAALLVVLLAWLISSPVGSSPDEDFHLGSIWCGQGEDAALCQGVTGEPLERRVPSDLPFIASCFKHKPMVSADCQSISDQPVLQSTNRLNSDGLYPTGYYAFMNEFVSLDLVRSVLLVRLVNVIAAIGLFIATAWCAKGPARNAFIVSTLVGSVPLGLFVLASVNPSAWAIVGVSCFWVNLYVVSTNPHGRSQAAPAALAVLSAVVASVARADSAMYVALTLLAVLIASGQAQKIAKGKLDPILSGVAVISVIVSVVSFLSAGQDHVVLTGFYEDAPPVTPLTLFLFNLTHVHELVGGFFGIGWGLGWLDTSIPAVAGVLVLIALGLLLTLRGPVQSRQSVVAVVLLAGAIICLPLFILQLGDNYVGQVVQPRYLLPLLYPLLGLFLLGQRAAVRAPHRARLIFPIVAISIAHSLALHANLRRYVTGTDVSNWNLNHEVEWWWTQAPSPMITWSLGSLAFACLAWVSISWLNMAQESSAMKHS